MKITTPMTLIAVIALSACGGARTSTSAPFVAQTPPKTIVPAPVAPARTSFATQEATRRAMLNDFATLDLTPVRNLPLRGTLTYDGILNTSLGDNRQAIGDLNLDVSLGGIDRITGGVTNLVDDRNRPYKGQLSLINGAFDAVPFDGDYQARAGLTGLLTSPDLRQLSVSGQLEGDVLGRDAQAFEGIVTGAVKVDGGPQQPIKGGALADRQF